MSSTSAFILIPTAVLICGIGISAGCASRRDPEKQAVQAPPSASPEVTKTNKVNYKGVSLTLDRSLASELTSETVRAVTDGKPCDIWPEHPAFTLVGYPLPRGLPQGFPHLRVFEIARFRDAMRIAGEEDGKNIVPPRKDDWSKDVDENASVLKKLVDERPSADRIKAVIGKHAGIGCYDIPQVPFLPEWEACQPFVAHVRYVDFKNGKGIFFLTQWLTETEQITNEGLEYAFQ